MSSIVVVVGAGISGLAAALALHKVRHGPASHSLQDDECLMITICLHTL